MEGLKVRETNKGKVNLRLLLLLYFTIFKSHAQGRN